MRLCLVANVRHEQSKLDGLLANVCERLQTFSFIERRAFQLIYLSHFVFRCYPNTRTEYEAEGFRMPCFHIKVYGRVE